MLSIGGASWFWTWMPRPELRELFDAIVDPRVQRTRRHQLTDVLMLVLIETVCGCQGWDEIKEYGDEWEQQLREVLALPMRDPDCPRIARRLCPGTANASRRPRAH